MSLESSFQERDSTQQFRPTAPFGHIFQDDICQDNSQGNSDSDRHGHHSGQRRFEFRFPRPNYPDLHFDQLAPDDASQEPNDGAEPKKPGDKQITWETNVIEAYHTARDSGKPLAVLFSTDWCEYCQKLESDVLNTPAMQGLAGRAVFLRVNPEKDKDGDTMAKSLNVTGYPTMVVLDAQPDALNEKGRVVGYMSADEFVEQLASYLPAKDTAPVVNNKKQPMGGQIDFGEWAGIYGEVLEDALVRGLIPV